MKDQENIIARARRGDAGAFEQLVETYRDQVYRIALRMCGNAADADEAITEVSAPDPAPGPQQQAERRETQEAVRNAILQLTPEYRQIVVLRFLEDLSYEEIGAALKLPSGTVKSRLNRAKAQLKDILSKSGNLFGSPSVIHTETQGKEARP